MPDPTTADRQPMNPSRGISPDELLRQLADAELLTSPMPPGPRPGQACCYKGGEVFYVDPAVLDRLESKLPVPAREANEVNHDLVSLLSAYAINRPSMFRTDA
jgi:hypothetical protein